MVLRPRLTPGVPLSPDQIWSSPTIWVRRVLVVRFEHNSCSANQLRDAGHTNGTNPWICWGPYLLCEGYEATVWVK